MEKVNVILNIGMTTKHGMNINEGVAINFIGSYTDCTITKCIGFYKGHRENSLKVEIYDTTVAMQSIFQELLQDILCKSA